MKERHTAEQIVAKLREAEVELAEGEPVPEVVRKLGISERRACQVLGQPRSTQRRPPSVPDDGSRLVARTVDLDFMVCHFDWHGQKIKDIRKQHGKDVAIRVLEEEGVWLIQSDRDDLPLADVVEDFGLMSYREFHRRHREQLERMRSG